MMPFQQVKMLMYECTQVYLFVQQQLMTLCVYIFFFSHLTQHIFLIISCSSAVKFICFYLSAGSWEISYWLQGTYCDIRVVLKCTSTDDKQTTVSLRLGGGVQTETIRFPSKEGSSFQCHFYILSHSLSPVHWDYRCYLLPSVYL